MLQTLLLAAATAMAGEREEFIQTATKEIVRRKEGLTTEIASYWAEEMWSASVIVSQWFKYKLDPKFTLVRWCIESNGSNKVANKSRVDGSTIPFQRWSVGMFHLRVFPIVQELEAMNVPYTAPIVDWFLNHPKHQIWCVSRFQARWLKDLGGNNIKMIEVYRYGRSFEGKSEYYKDFARIYTQVWGKQIPSQAKSIR